MRFEYIVLLIIAFNVITAVMQRRAKKAREKAVREAGGGTVGGTGSRGPAYEYEDMDEEDLDGEFRDPYADRDPVPTTTSRRAGRDAVTGGGVTRRHEGEPMQMPSMGRDILDQLARDLGLKPPKPAAPRPVAKDTGVVARAKVRAVSESIIPHIPQSRPVSSPVRIARGIEEVAHSRKVPGSKPLRVDLHGRERLREAFVLKEILDVPVSRRRRPAA